MITHSNDSIKIEMPDLHIPESEVNNIINDYFHKEEMKSIDEAIDKLKKTLISLEDRNMRLQKNLEAIKNEKWRDNELQDMKQKMEQAIQESNYGFPLTKLEHDNAYSWQRKHDTEVHFNPKGYHGASGGGFSYTFYPTGLGTTCNCFCNQCKAKAIREAGEKWYDRCKELGGVYEVVGWEAF